MCSDASLQSEVDALAAVDVSGLPIEALQMFVADVAHGMTRLGGVMSRALGELQVRGGGSVPDTGGMTAPTPAWLRSVTKTTGTTAGRQIRTAVALRELPLISAAIVRGDVTEEHGRVLTRLVGKIDATALRDSEPALVEVARRCDPDQLAHFVRHQIATWCEPALDADEESAEQARFFSMRNKHNGRWRGTFDVPDAIAEMIQTVIEPLARRDGDAGNRSAGQRRLDALADVFGLAVRHADLPVAGGARPRLTYVIPASWAVRLPTPAERALGTEALPSAGFTLDLEQHPGQGCASAPWTGPATRSLIETLRCDAQIDRVVLDAAGQVVSLTSVSEQITAAQRRAIAARDRCCVAKGCSKPPAFCDVHHLRARADGGSTDVGNLVLLCRRHHVMWHREQLTISDLRVAWLLPQPRAPSRT